MELIKKGMEFKWKGKDKGAKQNSKGKTELIEKGMKPNQKRKCKQNSYGNGWALNGAD